MPKQKHEIGYIPTDTRDGATYYVTENGGASTLCRRASVTLAGLTLTKRPSENLIAS